MLEEDADCLVVLRDLAGQLLAQEPEKGGTRKSRVAVPQEWLEKIRKAWERAANGALERTAELSREPNVHLGPQMFAELPGEQDSLDPRRGPSSGSARVSRGGCWLIVARYCRSSFRYYDSPGYRYISLGFRLLRIVPQRWALLHSYPVNHDVSNGRRQAAKARQPHHPRHIRCSLVPAVFIRKTAHKTLGLLRAPLARVGVPEQLLRFRTLFAII